MIRRFSTCRLSATLLVGLCVTSGIASADEKSHRDAAVDFIKAAGIDKTFEPMIDQSIETQVKANPMMVQLKPVLKKFMSKYLSFESLKDDMIKLYMEEFTEEELKAIAAFYRTPAGKKAVDRMPVLAMKGAEMGMKKVQENVGELQRMIVEELNKKPAPETPEKDK